MPGGSSGPTWRRRPAARHGLLSSPRSSASPCATRATYGALLRDFHSALTGPVRPFAPGCPVLVLCGDRDLTTPPEQARRVAGSLAGARLELVEDAGHYPWAERPEAVAARLAAFLDGVL